MKSESDVFRRLKKLRVRYARNYIKDSQRRNHRNCRYNHSQKSLQQSVSKVEHELVPCRTEIIIDSGLQDTEMCYCTYRMDDPENWPGVCDNDEIARNCKWFVPMVNSCDARKKFLQSMKDDEFVYNTYRDIAILQWVLGDRIHKYALSWWERFVIWLTIKLSGPEPSSALPPAVDIPEDLWDDSSKDS